MYVKFPHMLLVYWKLTMHLGNEIYLDLTYLKSHTAYLAAFLKSVQKDLAPEEFPMNQNGANLVDSRSDEAFNVQFESALKYVEIPLFGSSPSGSRAEATSILTWLRTCKGVNHIFEVRVEDSLQNPHSEENIANALEGLDVHDMDWRAHSVYRAGLLIGTIANPGKCNLRI